MSQKGKQNRLNEMVPLPYSDASIPVKQGDQQGQDEVRDRPAERGTSGLGGMGS